MDKRATIVESELSIGIAALVEYGGLRDSIAYRLRNEGIADVATLQFAILKDAVAIKNVNLAHKSAVRIWHKEIVSALQNIGVRAETTAVERLYGKVMWGRFKLIDEKDPYVVLGALPLTLPEREVLHLRFWGNKTQSQVAEILNMSLARVGRLESNALNELRQPHHYNLFEKVLRLASDINLDLKMPNDLSEPPESEPELDQKPELEIDWGDESLSVKELGLSTRATNCLRRGGISTLGRLLKTARENPQEIQKLRNLGQKTYEEIMAKLDECP